MAAYDSSTISTIKSNIQSNWHGTLPAASIDYLVDQVFDNLKALIGKLTIKVVAGGSAGDFTVTGIATADELIQVLHIAGAGSDVTDVEDLTSEFTISAADTINNTDGTASTGGKLLVIYLDFA